MLADHLADRERARRHNGRAILHLVVMLGALQAVWIGALVMMTVAGR